MKQPETIDECMQALSEKLSVEQQAEFLRTPREDLISLHHSLGRWMRNNWSLWQGGSLRDVMLTMGFVHADDMSQALIEEYWSRLNNLPSELEVRAQESIDYWKKEKHEA